MSASSSSEGDYGDNLDPQHVAKLAKVGITPEVAEARGYYTEHTKAAMSLLGLKQATTPALMIPIHGTAGGAVARQARFDDPPSIKGQRMRYLTKTDAAVFDCPPACRCSLGDPTVRLILVESPMQADCIASCGACALALVGAHHYDPGDTDLHVDQLEPVALAGDKVAREVLVVLASDIVTKPDIHRAMVTVGDRLCSYRHAHVRFVYLPEGEMGTKCDVDDYLRTHTVDDLWALGTADHMDAEPEEIGDEDHSVADKLVALALERYDLVQSEEGDAFVVRRDRAEGEGPPAGPKIAQRLDTKALGRELAFAYFDKFHKASSGGAMSDAIRVLEGIAARTDPVTIALRVAQVGRVGQPGHVLVLDLCRQDGTFVLIKADGWTTTTAPPVLFRRTKAMSALPLPAAPGAGDLSRLRRLLNVTEEGWHLIIAWLLAALFADISHPILYLMGEQGTAKSWAGRLCGSVVDPSPAPLRGQPTEIRDWMTQALASWVCCLDNVSSIPPWLSDALCRASTGDGRVDRELYTNNEPVVLAFNRVLALTTVGIAAIKGDLAERTLPVTLAYIPEEDRREEEAVRADFDDAHATILTGLLDLSVKVLAALPDTRPERLPRLADFMRIVAAIDVANESTGQKIIEGNAEATYRQSLRTSLDAILEANPLAVAVVTFMAEQVKQSKPIWENTPTELLDALEHIATGGRKRDLPKYWPATASAMSFHLNKLAPQLRARGITIDTGRHDATGDHRLIRIEKTA